MKTKIFSVSDSALSFLEFQMLISTHTLCLHKLTITVYITDFWLLSRYTEHSYTCKLFSQIQGPVHRNYI